MYNVTEGTDSNVKLCAKVLQGILEREVMVMFSTSDDSATFEGLYSKASDNILCGIHSQAPTSVLDLAPNVVITSFNLLIVSH